MWQLDILTTDNEYPEIETILETQEVLSLSTQNIELLGIIHSDLFFIENDIKLAN